MLAKITKYYKQLFVNCCEKKNLVVLSRSEYNSLQETLHLLGSTKNAQRIFESLDEFNSKKTPTTPQ